ncbi:MAG: molybdenum cofactor guanylyltransferase [Candidatus Altiarchaeota archaeon]|nr:molybdenum cofactor guanylyltransferase [Candidatus Altiarchaeota archaeon]MBU4266537.1 molybdenum cofactor guanylyltransferase [Candidatus Altiarchaeota archaeon]MBU4437107.1 molybdenum cofactor guanylyltransferase [Candidatus Altiarchaeota archaeon]
MATEAQAIMLAGESRRIPDKPFAGFRGRELMLHGYDILNGIFPNILIVCNKKIEPRIKELIPESPIIFEDLNIGPLGGILEGMKNLNSEYVFVTACDMPFLNPEVIEFLCREAEKDGAVPLNSENLPEPLHAVYRREKVLELSDLCLEGGKVTNLIERMNPKLIPAAKIKEYDSNLMTFKNINNLEDLEDEP